MEYFIVCIIWQVTPIGVFSKYGNTNICVVCNCLVKMLVAGSIDILILVCTQLQKMFLLPQNFSLWFRNRNFFTWRNIFIKKTREKIFLEINEKYFQSLSGGISRNMGFYFGTARRSSLNFRFYLKIKNFNIIFPPFRSV